MAAKPISIDDETAFQSTAATPAPLAPMTIDDDAAFKPVPGRLGAGYNTLKDGALGGLSDEFKGVDGAIGNAVSAAISGKLPSWSDMKKAYVKGRDEHQGVLEEAHKAYPVQSAITEGVGGVFMPVPGGAAVGLGKAAVSAAKGASALAKVGKAAKAAAVQGGISGFGHSKADLTEGDVVGVLRDTGAGALAGAVVGGAAGSAGVGVKKAAESIQGNLKKRIANEVAEGAAAVTGTGRKRIDKAINAIHDEVVKGPDSSKVRAAYRGDAEKGREQIGEIVERIGKKREANYAAFEKAGKSEIKMPTYQRMLDRERAQALKDGDRRLADGLRKFQESVFSTVEETGGKMELRQLRGMTTQAQEIAASVLGSLNENANSRVAGRVQAVVTKAMDDTLSLAAKGNSTLEKAASSIRRNNKRFHALLTIDDSLRLRQYKENTSRGAFENAGRKAATVGGTMTGGATLGALLSGDDDKAEGAMKGAAYGAIPGAMLSALPRIGRGIDRTLTTVAIKAAQGKAPVTMGGASAVASAAARSAAKGAVNDNADLSPEDVGRLQASASGKGPSPKQTIDDIAKETGLPLGKVRAAYIRMTVGQ